MAEEVSNKQVILKNYVTGFPKETDMEIINSTIKLKLPDGDSSSGVVLVKNLYLSCDPYMRSRMKKTEGSYVESFTPGSVSFFFFFKFKFAISFLLFLMVLILGNCMLFCFCLSLFIDRA